MADSEYRVTLTDGTQSHDFLFNGGPISNAAQAQPAFQALGHAAAAWGRLEQHIDAILLQVNKEQHSNEIVALYDPDHPRPFTDKIRLLKRYFNQHPALKDQQTEIRDFAAAATKLSTERNSYIHGIFERYDADEKLLFIRSIRQKYGGDPYTFTITEHKLPL